MTALVIQFTEREKPVKCSFCGIMRENGKPVMVSNDRVHICSHCIIKCKKLLEES